MMRLLCLSLSLFFSFYAAARQSRPQSGIWRFELNYPNTQVPFLMELEPKRRGWQATLINGKERLDLGLVVVQKGNWKIALQTYQNYLEFTHISATSIKGYFVKPTSNPVEKIPLTGRPGPIHRFNRPIQKSSIELSGKWAMEMTDSNDKKTQAIALFDQSGDTLHASILTPTGDYRYIDGHVSGDQFLSGAFDGVYNFVFQGELKNKKLEGEIRSKSITKFTAYRDDKAELPDPLKQTQIQKVNFKFPNLKGEEVSLEQFKGKPVILQIFGSWCPNCIDELDFLAPWYVNNKSKGVEIIALSFEYANSPEEAKKHLQKVVNKRAIPYIVLLAGTSRDDKPEDKLPTLKNFISFPTTIFLNKEHKVLKVHAGFNGPGTGLYYSEFKKMFEETIEELVR